jgi:hypothetical protein
MPLGWKLHGCRSIVGVPGQQRQPGDDAHRQRHPHLRIAQHAPALRDQQQRDRADPDHPGEAVVAQRAQGQAQRQFHRTHRIDLAQQPRAGVHAQDRGQRHRHVRQGEDAERARQRHQQGQAAGAPAGHRAEPARGDARDQPRHQCRQQQERRAQRQQVLAAERHPQPRQPGGQPGQIRIGGGQVLAFLPIERLVDEQRQARGRQQLGCGDQHPQHHEGGACTLFALHCL